MKLATILLFLGCTVARCSPTVQPDLFQFEPTILAGLARLWIGFTHPTPAPLPLNPVEGGIPAPAIPSISKAETLALIEGAATKYRVPAEFVTSIVAAESNFNSAAVSPKGAIGLMQLMPSTAQQFGCDPAVPAQNIQAGTQYLRWLMERYQKGRGTIKHVIAAYNAGPGMVDRYRGVPPFRETRSYVARVLGFLKKFTPARKSARQQG